MTDKNGHVLKKGDMVRMTFVITDVGPRMITDTSPREMLTLQTVAKEENWPLMVHCPSTWTEFYASAPTDQISTEPVDSLPVDIMKPSVFAGTYPGE